MCSPLNKNKKRTGKKRKKKKKELKKNRKRGKKEKKKEQKKRIMLVSAGNYEKQYCFSRSAVSHIGRICIDVHVCLNVMCNLASYAEWLKNAGISWKLWKAVLLWTIRRIADLRYYIDVHVCMNVICNLASDAKLN